MGAVITRRVIVETIERLPIDVQIAALKLRYVSIGVEMLGLAEWFEGVGVVFLSDDVTRTRWADAHSIVAHEIAHHWREHTRHRNADLSERFRQEAEACLLVSMWGFSGFGANVAAQQRIVAGVVRDIFGRFPGLLAPTVGDHLTTWEVGWTHYAERRWDDLVTTFTDDQRTIFDDWRKAHEMAARCAAARAGRQEEAELYSPPDKGA